MASAHSTVVRGFVAPGFEAVSHTFAEMLAADPQFSAQFCAYAAGGPVVDVWGGPEIGNDSIQGVFSATKGVAGVCIALLLDRGLLDLDATVSHYWPQFAQGGKGDVTVRLALSHQAGLIGVEPQVTLDQLLDHEYMADRLAAQRPHWAPGTALGYHPFSIGTVMDELVRHIDGRSLATFFHEEIGAPRAIDFYVATPQSEERRVLDVLPAPPAPRPDGLSAHGASAAPEVDSLTGMAFNAARTDVFNPPLTNSRSVRAAGQAAASGTGTARGLARLYASCISDVDGVAPLLSAETVGSVSQIQAIGHDVVLGHPSRFGIVFQTADERLWYGSHQAFGHDGAGGAIGVADPWHDLAYGYVPRRMTTPSGADTRGLTLARTVRECLSTQPPNDSGMNHDQLPHGNAQECTR